jgi:hypothetical protein
MRSAVLCHEVPDQPRRSSLSPAKLKLLLKMQRLNFGRIENLVITDGQPVFSPSSRVVRSVKFGGKNGPRPEASLEDFALKDEVIELLRYVDEIRDGVINILEIQHGLPFRMTVEDVA